MKIKWMMMTAAVLASAVTASAAIMTSDTFTGTALSAQWTAYPGGGNSPVTVAGGKLNTTISSLDGTYNNSFVKSSPGYTLPSGNFLVQIDQTKGVASGWWQGCFLEVDLDGKAYQLRQEWQDGSNWPVHTVGAYSSGVTSLTYQNMQFKIVREATTLSFYAKSLAGTDWTTIGFTTVGTGDATVLLGVYNSVGNSVTSSWDNFIVAIPEPASLGLLALGGVVLFRRRR